jgi:dTDP-glucose 4,6-dehydratase
VDITDMDGVDEVFDEIEPDLVGRTYNIGGNNEKTNIEVVDTLCHMVAEQTGTDVGEILALKQFVTDRPGHDLRYAIDATRIREECDWEPKETFDTGIRKTVKRYLSNQDWVQGVRSGEYRKWMDLNYGDRTG